MKSKFAVRTRSRFMIDVASVATRVESQMPAALFRHIDANAMASQTKIALLIAGGGLHQLIFVVGGVRVMALQAVANRWAVNDPLKLCSIFVRVAGEAQTHGRGGHQLYAGNVPVHANLVTDIASEGDCRMDELAFGLALMASGALRGICVLVEGDGVNIRKTRRGTKQCEGYHYR